MRCTERENISQTYETKGAKCIEISWRNTALFHIYPSGRYVTSGKIPMAFEAGVLINCYDKDNKLVQSRYISCRSFENNPLRFETEDVHHIVVKFLAKIDSDTEESESSDEEEEEEEDIESEEVTEEEE